MVPDVAQVYRELSAVSDRVLSGRSEELRRNMRRIAISCSLLSLTTVFFPK